MKVYDRKQKQHLEISNVFTIELRDITTNCWIIFRETKPMIFVKCKCFKEDKNGNIQMGAGIITLFNELIKPNQWFEIPGFLEAYLEYKKRYSYIVVSGMFTKDVVQKQIKKFERKLSPENKLLLEVCDG